MSIRKEEVMKQWGSLLDSIGFTDLSLLYSLDKKELRFRGRYVYKVTAVFEVGRYDSPELYELVLSLDRLQANHGYVLTASVWYHGGRLYIRCTNQEAKAELREIMSSLIGAMENDFKEG